MRRNPLSTIALYYHTLKYLKPIQIYGQILYRLKKYKKKSALKFFPNVRSAKNPWICAVPKKDILLSANILSCLNLKIDISAKTIWHDDSKTKLWLYHLHYFHYICTLNKRDASNLIMRWIKENQAFSPIAWDVYPTSLRIVNWIKWLLQDNQKGDLSAHAFASITHSLATQIDYVAKHLEFHILGNHLLANAKALIFGGLYFNAQHWLQLGLKIFNAEINEQIHDDGGHFELSPMYHAIILEDLLDIINLHQVYELQYPSHLQTVCQKMFIWLTNMCHPDGGFAFFNDTALNVAADLAELSAYQSRLNLDAVSKDDAKSISFRESGYYRLEHANMVLIADAAPIGANYQPGHAHADTLSFELSIQQKRVLVNSGISTYNDHDAKRLKERATRAHNTVIINEQNSSHIWKSFRVARRAHVSDIQLKDNQLQATHNGYYQRHHILHTREWQFENNMLQIRDHIAGHGQHKIEILFHLHPDIEIIQLNHLQFALLNAGNPIANFNCDCPAEIIANTYHPGFNTTLPNKSIMIAINAILPITLHASINSHQRKEV